MFASFRQSMAWLHTWFGLVLGFVLMVAFFFGALSVFDREIDRWAIPETRFEPQPMPSFDRVLRPVFERIEPREEELAAARERVGGPLEKNLPLMNWSAYTTHRDPVLTMYAEFAVTNNPDDPADHAHGWVTIDPRNGQVLPDDQLKIGSEFFYPLHYSLHLHWKDLGYWIVGLAALVMLAALVSGVLIHRKLFRELFTFRPWKAVRRGTLDLHNLTGVVALPFHFVFAFTGLVIFASIYLPVGETQLRDRAHAFYEQEAAAKGLAYTPSGQPAPLASVDAMVVEAKRRWATRGMPGEVGWLTVTHVGDSNSYVSIYRAGSDRVALVGQAVHFSGTSGAVIHEEPPPNTASSISEFLTGLHLQHFEHWLLRWFYVFGGLAGCVCIATGFIFFIEKRRRQDASLGSFGLRIVDAFAITTVTGIVVAASSLLLVNRLLPEHLPQRASWEEGAFWCAWLLTFMHAASRSAAHAPTSASRAWREQCAAIAVLAPAAVLANWITTGDHLLATLGRGYWPVAGLDLALLVAGAIAATAAMHLSRRARAAERSANFGTPVAAAEAERA
ncbi:MAG: peptidase [Steroidobacteraceae bacterium]|nr:peptidase [Steroidobacteraceae bacterium]